jgi:hypothetical protein
VDAHCALRGQVSRSHVLNASVCLSFTRGQGCSESFRAWHCYKNGVEQLLSSHDHVGAHTPHVLGLYRE